MIGMRGPPTRAERKGPSMHPPLTGGWALLACWLTDCLRRHVCSLCSLAAGERRIQFGAVALLVGSSGGWQ